MPGIPTKNSGSHWVLQRSGEEFYGNYNIIRAKVQEVRGEII